MSIPKEFGVRNPPSALLSVVVGKHNSATRCANPQCSKELLYLREGSLQLLELESRFLMISPGKTKAHLR